MERAEIADHFKVDPNSGAFKRAIGVIRARLTACRQCDPCDIADPEGTAAKEFLFDTNRYLVLVDCPESAHPASRPWQLRARFKRLEGSRSADKADAAERPLESGLEDFPDALPYFRIIAEHVRHARQRFAADDRKQLFVNDYAAHVIRSSTYALGHLPDGVGVTPYADFSLLTKFVAELSAGQELFGLSDWSADHAWWSSSDGKAFITANSTAISRGATIRRIFVAADGLPADAAHALDQEISRQREMGVRIVTVAPSEVVGVGSRCESQCVLRTRDDGRTQRGWLTYNVRLDSQGHPVENVFSIDDVTIEKNEKLLERLWSKATTSR